MTSSNRYVLLYAAPVLLIVVALCQRYFAYSQNLTSWIGGGFGMFATFPTEMRRMSITVYSEDGSEFRILPQQIEDRVHLQGRMSRIQREIISHPSPQRLQELARELVDSEWIAIRGAPGSSARLIPGLSDDFLGNRADTIPFPVAAVRIDVWKYVPDFASRKAKRSQLASVTVESGQGGHAQSQ